MRETPKWVGMIGEKYAMFRLGELGINSINVGDFFDYDLITSNNKRLEVKTGIIREGKKKLKSGHVTTWKHWEFGNSAIIITKVGKNEFQHTNVERDRGCDFFVLVCLDKERRVVKSYIIPKDVIGTKLAINVGEEKMKGQYDNYKERWDLIGSEERFIKSTRQMDKKISYEK